MLRLSRADTWLKRKQSRRVFASELYRRITMAVNLKLTHAVKDRVVQNCQLNGSELLISFVDGSTMTITIVECNSLPLHEGARISKSQKMRRSFYLSVKTRVRWTLR